MCPSNSMLKLPTVSRGVSTPTLGCSQALNACSPDTDLPQETLTSNLRSILIVRSYRWKLEPPKRRRSADGHLELPIVKMVILDFDLHSGNKDSPIYFEDTCEIGKGKNDGPVQKVLRKWYFGE